MFCKLSGIS